MAKYKNDIIGPITGKIGNMVFCSWNGVPYVRRSPGKRTRAATANQLIIQNKFGMAQSWLKPILEFTRVGYNGYTSKMTGANAAASYLLRNAFEKAEGKMIINPALMQVSSGNLMLPLNIAVKKNKNNKLVFTWDNSLQQNGQPCRPGNDASV
jgi:hypothetical protein